MSHPSTRRIRTIRDSFTETPGYDTAVSHAILLDVAAGREIETLRLFRPQRIVAFGRQDTIAPRYQDALRAALTHGFTPIERLAGGRAAVFHESTIAFAWSIPSADPRRSVTDRFETVASIMVEACAALGIDARVGEIPGEYCPGRYSVNAGGRTKLMGVGQRIVGKAAHVGGVVVVDDHHAIIDVLTPVYQALDLDWDPAVTGSLRQVEPTISWERAAAAILAAFGSRYELIDGSLATHTRQAARQLTDQHRPP